MLLMLGLVWGVTWPAMKIALWDFPPFSVRFWSTSLGALVLFAIGRGMGHSFRLPSGIARVHVALAGAFNIAGFGIFATLAQVTASTSRVAFLAYTMPIWASLLAWLVLGERIDRTRAFALALCVCGMVVLIYPLLGDGATIGIVFAVGAGMSWAIGTVYTRWLRLQVAPPVLVFWQFAISFVVTTAFLPFFEGFPHVWPASAASIAALTFTGVFGSGLAYFLWFNIIGRLPAAVASLGALMSPVVGAISSAILLGERPTGADLIGFACILAAAACVLLQPGKSSDARPAAQPERNDA